MALTQVREPPDVAQSHAEAHAGEQILGFVVPFGPVAHLLLLHSLQVVIRRDAVFQTWVWKLHFNPHHSVGLSKLVSAAAEMFALRCFRECAKKALMQPPLAREFYPTYTTSEEEVRY